MTSNHADRLDKALVRPGRIDKMIFLGNISQRSAELMFLRMYAPDHTQESTPASTTNGLQNGELEKLALNFSSQIPDDTFTPAQLQGYLLNRRNSPARAAEEASDWVEEEKALMEEAKLRAKEARKWRAKKQRKQTMKLLASHGIDIELAKDMADAGRVAAKLAAAKEDSNPGETANVQGAVSVGADGEAKEPVSFAVTAEAETHREVKKNLPITPDRVASGRQEETMAMSTAVFNGGTDSEEVAASTKDEEVKAQDISEGATGNVEAVEELKSAESTGTNTGSGEKQ